MGERRVRDRSAQSDLFDRPAQRDQRHFVVVQGGTANPVGQRIGNREQRRFAVVECPDAVERFLGFDIQFDMAVVGNDRHARHARFFGCGARDAVAAVPTVRRGDRVIRRFVRSGQLQRDDQAAPRIAEFALEVFTHFVGEKSGLDMRIADLQDRDHGCRILFFECLQFLEKGFERCDVTAEAVRVGTDDFRITRVGRLGGIRLRARGKRRAAQQQSQDCLQVWYSFEDHGCANSFVVKVVSASASESVSVSVSMVPGIVSFRL